MKLDNIRVLDVFFSLFILILFSPICILIAILIKLENVRGTILVENHIRLGKDKKPFVMYKFRTMVPNAYWEIRKNPELQELRDKQLAQNGKLSIKEDVRITMVGRIIRKLDLDELPQFINVLKGDMSLVGPRPYFQEEYDLGILSSKNFKQKIDKVLSVPPGITGLWQISGRNKLSMNRRIDLEYEYIKKRCFVYNLYIILSTPSVVLTRYGAMD